VSNVLTAGQIPTSCEVMWVKSRMRCGGKPVTHTSDGRLYHWEDGHILIRWYVCEPCAQRHQTDKKYLVIPLTDYEVEEARPSGIH